MISESSHGPIGPGYRSRGGAVFLFDERCLVCRRFVAFAKRLDRYGHLRFAPLQSLFGDTLRRAHSEFATRDSTLLVRSDGSILAYSDAILASLEIFGGHWRRLALLLNRIPRHLRDRAYTAFTKRRKLLDALNAHSITNRLFAHTRLSLHQW